MKRNFYLLFLISSILMFNFSCTEDEPETTPVSWELYTKLCPDDKPSLVSSIAYLYPASNNEEFLLETFDYNASDVLGDPQDYPAKEGKAKLKDGTTKHFDYRSTSLDGKFSRVKPGRYLLVVFVDPGSDEKYFAYQNKYSAKYIDVKLDQQQATYIKTLGGDILKKGYQEWDFREWKCYAN